LKKALLLVVLAALHKQASWRGRCCIRLANGGNLAVSANQLLTGSLLRRCHPIVSERLAERHNQSRLPPADSSSEFGVRSSGRLRDATPIFDLQSSIYSPRPIATLRQPMPVKCITKDRTETSIGGAQKDTLREWVGKDAAGDVGGHRHDDRGRGGGWPTSAGGPKQPWLPRSGSE